MKTISGSVKMEVKLTPFGYAMCGFEVVSSPEIPKGQYFADPNTHRLLVHPDDLPDVLNKLRMCFDDRDGHRAFAI